MTRPALLWAAIKASLWALVATAGVALLIFGSAELNGWLARNWLEPQHCAGALALVCGPSKFWVSYWWMTLLVIIGPAWIVLLIMFIRKFATHGDRLIVAGFLGIFHGACILMDGLKIFYAPAPLQGTDRSFVIGYLALGASLLAAGVYFGLLWKPTARQGSDKGT